MEPDIGTRYEIRRTAEFLRAGAYTRVALQFPDEMLKDAAAVARALRRELATGGGGVVRVFVMADTAYNSCCVDEVGASHVDAECVVHYGHACMSPHHWMSMPVPAQCRNAQEKVTNTFCYESVIKYYRGKSLSSIKWSILQRRLIHKQ